MFRIYLISAIILVATYGCFGSVPSYYSRDNWKTVEEANKISIVKAVNRCRNTASSEFTMNEWKKFRYNDKIQIINESIRLHTNDGVIISIPSSFYVKELDLIMLNFITSKDKDSLQNTAIPVTFHTLSAMEGDWGNGEEACEHAKAYFGGVIFDEFRRLFPDKYNNLCKNGYERQKQIQSQPQQCASLDRRETAHASQ